MFYCKEQQKVAFPEEKTLAAGNPERKTIFDE
jgi:hypothetical protein